MKGEKIKKLVILLIVVLVGVLFINALPSPSTAEVRTLASVITFLDTTLKKMTQNELDMLEKRFTQEEFDSATRLMTQWGNLLRIATEAGKIISER